MNFFISFIRFLSVFVILFLLLKPALSLYRNITEKPVLVIAQDNSASLLNNKDSIYIKNNYAEELKKTVSALEENFQVEWLTFGKNTHKNNHIDFSEHYTDISGLFQFIDDAYRFKTPDAVLLLSDGRYNTGMNPRYKVSPYPVYTVGVGDTTEFPDVYIRNVLCDKFNFLNTLFPVKIEVAAVRQNGKQIKCVLKENNRIIGSRTITIDGDNFLEEVTFEVEAKQKGLRKYTVTLETNFPEFTNDNNSAVIYTNILDNSGEIQLFYHAPHPDISAISEAIRTAGIYTYETHSIGEFKGELSANLLILHNPLMEDTRFSRILEIASQRKISVWMILTERKNIISFAGTGKLFTTAFPSVINEYAQPTFNRNFSLFEFSEQEIQGYQKYPPLVVPFGDIRSNAGRPLFYQKIKNVDTENVILGFYDNNNHKTACLIGEGFWKWKYFSFRETGSHELFNALVHKTINYLIARKGNDRFIHDIKPLYDETEETVIYVELYNESYELVNTPDVTLQLKAGDKEFVYILNRSNDRYRISLGNLGAGEYSYTLKTNLKGENFEKKGSFFVRTQNPEVNDVVADWTLLQEISERSGGKFTDLTGLSRMVKEIDNKEFRATNRKEIRYVELGELKWLGIFLLLLLCLEWFLLKYYAE